VNIGLNLGLLTLTRNTAYAMLGIPRSIPASQIPFRDKNILYVFAFPKSGSRLLSKALIDSRPPKSNFALLSPPAPLNDSGYLVNLEVRPDYLRIQREGLIHSHAAALPMNAHILHDMGMRYLVTVRHPADHITALFCHLRNSLSPEMRAGAETASADRVENALSAFANARAYPSRWHSVISPPVSYAFVEEVPIEDAISHLIVDGYLVSALKWLADWLWHRDGDRSLVVRYEDLLSDTDAVFDRCRRFVHRGAEPASPTEGGKLSMERPPRQADSFVYPRGYSGSIAIWQSYFSDRNRNEFNATVGSFVDLYKPAQKLVEYYPELILG
jgi:hypothetical protein